MASNNLIASVTYKCTTKDGIEYNLTGELHKSASFQYGNGTVLKLQEEGFSPMAFDSRYDSRFGTAEKFYKNILEFMKEHYDISKSELIRAERMMDMVMKKHKSNYHYLYIMQNAESLEEVFRTKKNKYQW